MLQLGWCSYADRPADSADAPDVLAELWSAVRLRSCGHNRESATVTCGLAGGQGHLQRASRLREASPQEHGPVSLGDAREKQ
jgi:hypothetical protein